MFISLLAAAAPVQAAISRLKAAKLIKPVVDLVVTGKSSPN